MSDLPLNPSEVDTPGSLEDENLLLTADDIEAAYERALQAISAAEGALPAGGDDCSTDDESHESAYELQSPLHEARSASRSLGDYNIEEAEDGIAIDQRDGLIQPRQVIEAALFVGGASLTSKRLGTMLGDDSSADEIEELVADLNTQYAEECRPYEIQLAEGGYHLVLKDEFQSVRDRVFGTSPKDVKLSQEALEVLAYIAYRQPVSKESLDETGKPNAPSLVRQLLRRQLVRLERGEGSSDDVTYRTTPRFLELFGLRSLNDLPLPEDLKLK